MIYLQPNQSNNVIATLWEGSKNQVNPYYTWLLVDMETAQQITFTVDDNSCVPYYYNSFTVSVVSIAATATPYGLTNGTINVNNGNYTYTVYEMVNPYDLDITHAVGIAENGLLNIAGTYSNYVVNTANDNATIVVNKNLNFYDQ